MQTGIRDWGDAVWASLAGAMTMFLAAIPKIIVFVAILIIGWLIASLVEKGVAALWRTVKFNNLISRSGFSDFFGRIGVKTDSAGFIALIMLVAVFNTLGTPALDVVSQLLLRLPNLVMALVFLVIGGLAAGALSSLVRGAASSTELGNPDLLATITSVAVRAFAIIIAINQIGIATTLVDTLLMVAGGAVAFTLGLTFGLSGYETTTEIVRGWYEKGKQVIPKMKGAAQDVKEQAQQQTRQPVQPPG